MTHWEVVRHNLRVLVVSLFVIPHDLHEVGRWEVFKLNLRALVIGLLFRDDQPTLTVKDDAIESIGDTLDDLSRAGAVSGLASAVGYAGQGLSNTALSYVLSQGQEGAIELLTGYSLGTKTQRAELARIWHELGLSHGEGFVG